MRSMCVALLEDASCQSIDDDNWKISGTVRRGGCRWSTRRKGPGARERARGITHASFIRLSTIAVFAIHAYSETRELSIRTLSAFAVERVASFRTVSPSVWLRTRSTLELFLSILHNCDESSLNLQTNAENDDSLIDNYHTRIVSSLIKTNRSILNCYADWKGKIGGKLSVTLRSDILRLRDAGAAYVVIWHSVDGSAIKKCAVNQSNVALSYRVVALSAEI